MPLDNILAEMAVTRKYFWQGSALTFYDFELTGIRMLPSPEVLATRTDPAFPALLEAELRSLLAYARDCYKVAKAAYEKTKLVSGPSVKGNPCPWCGTGNSKSKMMLETHQKLCLKKPG